MPGLTPDLVAAVRFEGCWAEHNETAIANVMDVHQRKNESTVSSGMIEEDTAKEITCESDAARCTNAPRLATCSFELDNVETS